MRPEKVEIMRPFGPSMARSKMPQELIDAFNTSADEVIKLAKCTFLVSSYDNKVFYVLAMCVYFVAS